MKKGIIGVIITIVIGGTGYTVSQSSIVNNYAKETGQSQSQAQTYVDNAQKNLVSYSKIGDEFISEGNSDATGAAGIDCTNYTYPWVTSSLPCTEGVSELQTISTDEINLGNCYKELDTNLGSQADATINECITDIDAVDSSYDQPIALALLSTSQITDFKNTNIYNKSTLQAALQSK